MESFCGVLQPSVSSTGVSDRIPSFHPPTQPPQQQPQQHTPSSSNLLHSTSNKLTPTTTTPTPKSNVQQLLGSILGTPVKKEAHCDVCDKVWVPDNSDPTEVFYPDEHKILPYKCPACCKKSYGGVSYVVPSESRQLGSDAKPLWHIVYQPKHLRCEASQFLTDCFHKVILEGEAFLTILAGEGPDQNNVREYLLRPERRREFIRDSNHKIVRGLESLQNEMLDKRMLVLHYKYHEHFVLSPCLVRATGDQEGNYDAVKSIEESDIQLGLLVRKGTNKDHGPSLNVRLDLYINAQSLWYRLSAKRRNELKYIQQLVEDRLLVCFRKWNDLSRQKHELTSSTDNSSLSSTTTTQQPGSPTSPTSSPKKTLTPGFLPLFLVSIRDIFKIELIPVTTEVVLTPPSSPAFGPRHNVTRTCTKTVWYFPRDNLPNNYGPTIGKPELPGEPVGLTQYNDFFTEEELKEIESQADTTDEEARTGRYSDVPLTSQSSKKGARVSRTKFFFSARYLWTKEQMDEPGSALAEGIRADVASPPAWMKRLIEKPLVGCGVVEEDYVNEFAMNIYHDGSEGLGQHFDDKKRFQRPIISLRIYSDCRLAFGSKDFAMVNSLFFVPMARGCVTLMEKDGYAADGIKHCIRASDMTGKSGVVLLRQIHPHVMGEAKRMYHAEWVTRWLESIPGLENPKQYVQGFVDEEINQEALCFLNECDLKSLGFTKMGPRKLVMSCIEELKERLTGKPPHPHMPCCCTCVSHLDGCKYNKENVNAEQPLLEPPKPVFQQPSPRTPLHRPSSNGTSKNRSNGFHNFHLTQHSSQQNSQQQQTLPSPQYDESRFVAEEVLEQGTTPLRSTSVAPSISTPPPSTKSGSRSRARGLSKSGGQTSPSSSSTSSTPPGQHKRRADPNTQLNKHSPKRPAPSSSTSSSSSSSSASQPSSTFNTSLSPSSTSNSNNINNPLLGINNFYSPFTLSVGTSTNSPPSSLFDFDNLPSLPSSPPKPASPPTPTISVPFPSSLTATTTTTPTTPATSSTTKAPAATPNNTSVNGQTTTPTTTIILQQQQTQLPPAQKAFAHLFVSQRQPLSSLHNK